MKNLGRRLLSVVLSLTIMFCCANTDNRAVLAFENDMEADLCACKNKLIDSYKSCNEIVNGINRNWNDTLTITEENLNNANSNILSLKKELDIKKINLEKLSDVEDRLNNCLGNEDCRHRLECAEGNPVACKFVKESEVVKVNSAFERFLYTFFGFVLGAFLARPVGRPRLENLGPGQNMGVPVQPWVIG